jgi:type 1 glutamine amidotransferase
MPKVLVLSGTNHGFDKSAPIINDALASQEGIMPMLTDNKDILASSGLNDYDVCLLGTGFARRQRHADGTSELVPELTPAQAEGLLAFVRSGKGLVGVHGTGWQIGGEFITLIGGHANWHPPGLEFTVTIDDPSHPITEGVGSFTVQDEIYMSAWDPAIHILASATWADKQHPMAWTHRYGNGRVFYTTLGHGPSTFENPAVQQMLANGTRWAAAGE